MKYIDLIEKTGKRGGGVAIFIKNSLICKRISLDGNAGDIE